MQPSTKSCCCCCSLTRAEQSPSYFFCKKVPSHQRQQSVSCETIISSSRTEELVNKAPQPNFQLTINWPLSVAQRREWKNKRKVAADSLLLLVCSCHQRQIAPKEEGTIAALLSRDERRDGSHCWRKGLARQCSFSPTLAAVGTHFISLTLLSLICQLVYFFSTLSLFFLFFSSSNAS